MACDEGIHFTKDHRYPPKLILSEKVYINSHYRPALNNLEPKSEPKSEPKPGLGFLYSHFSEMGGLFST